jgi:drug/metabolite transporter (DMT)-like permease
LSSLHAPNNATPDSRTKARLLVLATAVLWSSGGLFAKLTLFDDWRAEEVMGPLMAFWRALFAGMLLAPAIRGPRWRSGLLPMTLSFTAMNATYLTAMELTTAANAIWLQSTAPIWVLLVGVLCWREPLARRDTVLLGCGSAGVGLILACELTQQTGRTAGIAMGLAAGLFYAGVILSMRRLRGENGAWLVALNHLVAAGLLAPWAVYIDRWPSATQLAVLAVFGFVQMGLPYLLFARALRTLPGHEAAGIALLEPVLVPCWAWIARGEVPAWWTLAGGGLILVGLAAPWLPVAVQAASSLFSRGKTGW